MANILKGKESNGASAFMIFGPKNARNAIQQHFWGRARDHSKTELTGAGGEDAGSKAFAY